jgi:hypothetical protein
LDGLIEHTHKKRTRSSQSVDPTTSTHTHTLTTHPPVRSSSASPHIPPNPIPSLLPPPPLTAKTRPPETMPRVESRSTSASSRAAAVAAGCCRRRCRVGCLAILVCACVCGLDGKGSESGGACRLLLLLTFSESSALVHALRQQVHQTINTNNHRCIAAAIRQAGGCEGGGCETERRAASRVGRTGACVCVSERWPLLGLKLKHGRPRSVIDPSIHPHIHIQQKARPPPMRCLLLLLILLMLPLLVLLPAAAAVATSSRRAAWAWARAVAAARPTRRCSLRSTATTSGAGDGSSVDPSPIEPLAIWGRRRGIFVKRDDQVSSCSRALST